MGWGHPQGKLQTSPEAPAHALKGAQGWGQESTCSIPPGPECAVCPPSRIAPLPAGQAWLPGARGAHPSGQLVFWAACSPYSCRVLPDPARSLAPRQIHGPVLAAKEVLGVQGNSGPRSSPSSKGDL